MSATEARERREAAYSELLESAKDLAEVVHRAECGDYDEHDTQDALRDIRAAIKKAESSAASPSPEGEQADEIFTTHERMAPDAIEAVDSVLRTVEWVTEEIDEDPEQVEKNRRGVRIIKSWLAARLRAPEPVEAETLVQGFDPIRHAIKGLCSVVDELNEKVDRAEDPDFDWPAHDLIRGVVTEDALADLARLRSEPSETPEVLGNIELPPLPETSPMADGWVRVGSHVYREEGTSDCRNGCGCWAGPTRSGGPDGVDPLGTCPAATEGEEASDTEEHDG